MARTVVSGSIEMRTAMGLSEFKVISFDCYGTLIDWETGILRALLPLVSRVVLEIRSDQILETFARHEAGQQAETPAMIYSQLLSVVHARLASEWGVAVTEEENARFGGSIGDWPAFADSAAALRRPIRHHAASGSKGDVSPRTTCSVIVYVWSGRRSGRSYMMSSIRLSMIDRSALAPVPRALARRAISLIALSLNFNRAPS